MKNFLCIFGLHKWSFDASSLTPMSIYRNGIRSGGYTELNYSFKCKKCNKIKVFIEEYNSNDSAMFRVKELMSKQP